MDTESVNLALSAAEILNNPKTHTWKILSSQDILDQYGFMIYSTMLVIINHMNHGTSIASTLYIYDKSEPLFCIKNENSDYFICYDISKMRTQQTYGLGSIITGLSFLAIMFHVSRKYLVK